MFIFRRTYLKCLTETTEFLLDLEQLVDLAEERDRVILKC